MRSIFLLFAFCSYLFLGKALLQNAISIGSGLIFGVTVPGTKSELQWNSSSYLLSNNLNYMASIISGQYIIAEKYGLESGLRLGLKNYTITSLGGVSKLSFFGPSVEAILFQVPIHAIYILRHRHDPFIHYKLVAGFSLQWMNLYFTRPNLESSVHYHYHPILNLGIRYFTRQSKAGRVELGAEFQYSMQGRFQLVYEVQIGFAVFNSMHRALNLSVHYFF